MDLTQAYSQADAEFKGIKKQAKEIALPADKEQMLEQDITRLYAELRQVAMWKSYLKIREWMKTNKKPIIFTSLKTLINNGTTMSLEDALKYLEISEKEFYDRTRRDLVNFIVYMNEKAETLDERDFGILQDLQSSDKIGQFGQRLPRLINDVKDNYEPESLPVEINRYVDAGADITQLVHTTLLVGMRKQARDDLMTMLLCNTEEKINEISSKLPQLEAQKKEKEEEIKRLDGEIENRQQILDKINSDISHGGNADDSSDSEDNAPPEGL